MGLFSAIGAGLRKISFSAAIDDEYFDELEEQLILADVGVQTAGQIVAALRERAKKERLTEAAQLRPTQALLTKFYKQIQYIEQFCCTHTTCLWWRGHLVFLTLPR